MIDFDEIKEVGIPNLNSGKYWKYRRGRFNSIWCSSRTIVKLRRKEGYLWKKEWKLY